MPVAQVGMGRWGDGEGGWGSNLVFLLVHAHFMPSSRVWCWIGQESFASGLSSFSKPCPEAGP